MSAATAVQVRDLTTGTELFDVDVSDMPPGELTVQHILKAAETTSGKKAILVDGVKSTSTTKVNPGSQILLVPQVDNG